MKLVGPLPARSPGDERHCGGNEILQGRLIDPVALVDRMWGRMASGGRLVIGIYGFYPFDGAKRNADKQKSTVTVQ
jgi:hypothetical protein